MTKLKDKYLNSKTENHFNLNCHYQCYNTTKSGWPDFVVYKINKLKNEFAFCFVEVKRGQKQLTNWQKWIFTIFKYYNLPVYLLRNGQTPPLSYFRTIPYKEFKRIKGLL